VAAAAAAAGGRWVPVTVLCYTAAVHLTCGACDVGDVVVMW
jgi:hypothetical protein